MEAHAQAWAPGRNDLSRLALEWAKLDSRVRNLEEQSQAPVRLDWIRRRQAAIREIMLSTPAESMAGIGAKHRVAISNGSSNVDDDLRESAEDDLVRLFYG